MSTAHMCNTLSSLSSIVLYSDRREEPRWCLGGNQRQPGWLQQRRKDAPHSIITEQEARYVHLSAFRCNPWDFSCCASPSADLLSVALLKCLRLRIITGLEAGQHDDCPAGIQISQNWDFLWVYNMQHRFLITFLLSHYVFRLSLHLYTCQYCHYHFF